MNSRQRVYAALRKEPVDRVPVFMWFHPATTKRLAELLEIPATFVQDAMGNDIKQRWVGNNYAMEGVRHEQDAQGHVDFWGIRWVKRGPFNQIAEYPLAGAAKQEILRYQFPHEHVDELLGQMESIAGSGDYFIGCDVSPCVFEMCWRLRGM